MAVGRAAELGHLDVGVVGQEDVPVQPQAAVEQLGLEAQLIGFHILRPVREDVGRGVERPAVDPACGEAGGIGGIGQDLRGELVLQDGAGRPLALGVGGPLQRDVQNGRVRKPLVEDIVPRKGVALGLVRIAHAGFQAELVGDLQLAVDEGRTVLQGRRIIDQEVLDVRPAEEGETLEIHPAGVALAGIEEEAARGPVQPLSEQLAGEHRLFAELVVGDALVGLLDRHGDGRLAGAEHAAVSAPGGDRLEVDHAGQVDVEGVGEAPLLQVVDVRVQEIAVGVQVVGNARRQVFGAGIDAGEPGVAEAGIAHERAGRHERGRQGGARRAVGPRVGGRRAEAEGRLAGQAVRTERQLVVGAADVAEPSRQPVGQGHVVGEADGRQGPARLAVEGVELQGPGQGVGRGGVVGVGVVAREVVLDVLVDDPAQLAPDGPVVHRAQGADLAALAGVGALVRQLAGELGMDAGEVLQLDPAVALLVHG